MKKIIALLMVVMAGIGVASARDKIVYDDSPLPVAAKQTLSNNFKSKVNFVKIDYNAFGKIDDYEVVLRNGTEVEFDSAGNLKAVDAGSNGVPSSLILPSISSYVKKNCGNKKIVELDIEKNYYEVKLADGRELKFDRTGKFLSVDN